jgi:uncharacterized repeat protein (TIGR03803 family)
LVLSGDVLYGTAFDGGALGIGTIFRINTNGTGFTNLHSFAAGEGGAPDAGVILSGGTLYGTTSAGGSSVSGTVYKMGINGSGFTVLHYFTDIFNNPDNTNSDGALPFGALLLSGSRLFGTTVIGGAGARGVVFALDTDGGSFTNLHSFLEMPTAGSSNIDGSGPEAGLILVGDTLYGTTFDSVFRINTNGSAFGALHNFEPATNGVYPLFTNNIGAWIYAGLVRAGGALYGTAFTGGQFGTGTIFALDTNGINFVALHTFAQGTPGSGGTYINADGIEPQSGLVLSGNTLYGTAAGGGAGFGTVFGISIPSPQLAISRSATNVILEWPANAVGFSLQSTTNLVPPVSWNEVVSPQGVVNGNISVTNLISSPQNFYRLSQ